MDQQRGRRPMERRTVAVIGGGPSGIIAARYLRAHRFEPTIFEVSDEPRGAMEWAFAEQRRLAKHAHEYQSRYDAIQPLRLRSRRCDVSSQPGGPTDDQMREAIRQFPTIPRRNCSEYRGEVESSNLDECSAQARAAKEGEHLNAKSYLPDGFGVRDVGRMRGNAAPEGYPAC